HASAFFWFVWNGPVCHIYHAQACSATYVLANETKLLIIVEVDCEMLLSLQYAMSVYEYHRRFEKQIDLMLDDLRRRRQIDKLGNAAVESILCWWRIPLLLRSLLVMADVRSLVDSPSRHITVVDVYDLAASIGKDFERIIDEFGNDSVRQIMPKASFVISALETLESLANHNEKENEEVLMLKKTVERLENEKQMKQQDRIKFELELEAVEENYRKEIDDLWSMVKSLQLENKHLSSATGDDSSSLASNSILHNSVEKLIRQNEELLRKNASLQKQGRMLVEEKSEIVKRLQLTEEANIKLTKLFKDATRQCKDLQQYQMDESDNAPKFTLSELREVLQEKNLLKGKVLELEEELEQLRPSRRRESITSDSSREFDRSAQTEEYVVYGPINREPEEKLYPWKYERKQSGVRKLYALLYKKLQKNFRLFFNKEGGDDSPMHTSSSPIPSMRSMPSFSGQ
ncbi:unnamed protein product, partial [Litomosoides sigmodontis]